MQTLHGRCTRPGTTTHSHSPLTTTLPTLPPSRKTGGCSQHLPSPLFFSLPFPLIIFAFYSFLSPLPFLTSAAPLIRSLTFLSFAHLLYFIFLDANSPLLILLFFFLLIIAFFSYLSPLPTFPFPPAPATLLINNSRLTMACRACIMVLLVVASRCAVTQAPELWSGGNAAPVQIWSINAEVDMDQQTADVRVQGPRDMQAARDIHQYMTHLNNTQKLPEPRPEDAVTEPSREADPTSANPAKPRMVVAIKSACCDACEAPYAVLLLHSLAQGLGALVVLCMWMVLTGAILILFC